MPMYRLFILCATAAVVPEPRKLSNTEYDNVDRACSTESANMIQAHTLLNTIEGNAIGAANTIVLNNNLCISDNNTSANSVTYVDLTTDANKSATMTMATSIGNIASSALSGGFSGAMMGGGAGAAAGALIGIAGGAIDAAVSQANLATMINANTTIVSKQIQGNSEIAQHTRTLNADNQTALNNARNSNLTARLQSDNQQLSNSNAMRRSNALATKTTATTNATNTQTTAKANATRTKGMANTNAANTQTTEKLNATNVQSTTKTNATNTQTTAKTNATNIQTTEKANATNIQTTTKTNADNTRTTSRTNAGNTYDVTAANAHRTQTTVKNNSLYTRQVSELNAKETLENGRYLAQAAILDSRNSAPVTCCQYDGNPTADYMRTRGVQIKVRTQSDSAIRQAGATFARYGYALNQVWDVAASGLKLMRKFTYWKASDIWVRQRGESNNAVAAFMRDLFLNGITVWNDPSEIGNANVYEN